MSCVTLTKSRKLNCISKMPGVRAVGIGAYDGVNRIVKEAAGVTDLATAYGVGTIARFELKNTTTNYIENGVSGGDNRSTGVTGNIPCIFNVPEGADAEINAVVEELLKGEVVLFLEMNDGTIKAAGSQLGALAITADDQTGGTIGDLNGYTVTFNTMEPDFSRGYILSGQALTDYAAALMPYV
jgi:hypothetical protein